LFAAQQLRWSASAWWASYTTTLPKDHQFPWGEFGTTFCAHHVFVGLLCTKLKELLDLEQGNHTVYDYTRQFNTLAQCGSYHVDTDETKANHFRNGLSIQLQDRLFNPPTCPTVTWRVLPFIKERTMKAVAEAEEKKRKRIMPRSSESGGSSGAPLKYHIMYTPPSGQLHRPYQQ
jgi:hypothetical protein